MPEQTLPPRMASIKPYRISIPQSKLDTLKQKLALTTLTDELEDSEWEYGTPLADIKRLVAYWQDGFDWVRIQHELNQLPQYTIPLAIDGYGTLNIHFVHQPSQVEGAVPLLFSHGWPGSFEEVSKILSELVKGGKEYPAFHVVAPSLANFGFSEGTKKKGFGLKQHAEMCHKLMLALGYSEYVTQAGDLGYGITRATGFLYPSSCKASHFNVAVFQAPKQQDSSSAEAKSGELSARELADKARTEWFLAEGRGYNLEQCTKPQTLGYSLADSPVGLLAWILEKLHDWSDDYPWTDDEILTFVSIYLFSTAGPGAAQRVYYENTHAHQELREKLNGYVPDVKIGFARFPKELMLWPKEWNKSLGPVVFESEYDKGGHFAAYERPDAIIKDLRAMFGKGGGAYGVVCGKTGYES